MARPRLSDRIKERRATLGGRLQTVREHAGISREQLAAFADLEPDHVRRFERGQLSIPSEVLPDLARGCGVTSAHLLGEQPAIIASAAA